MLRLKSVNFETQQFQNHDLKPSHANHAEWLIGRNPTCDVVLTSPEVSRTHGRIIYANGTYQFIDAGSTSGSVLNGEVAQPEFPYKLDIGDLLQVGETFIYIEAVENPTPQSDIPTASLQLPGQDEWTNQDIWCRCDRIIDETPDVKTFCLIAEPPIFFNYLPGQFVTLAVGIEGKLVLRPYSISSTPSRPHHLSVTIKRVPSPSFPNSSVDGGELVPAGLVSNWMHDHFKLGDRLKLVGGPMGNFTCLPNLPDKMLLISAGSGVTPMLSMSRWVQDTIAATDVVFLHSARQIQDIVARSELEMMAAQMPNFRLVVTLTQATGTPWMGLTGRISPEMLNLMVPDLMDRSVFVCGPNLFMQHVQETLESIGFPMSQYQAESFGGLPAAPVQPKQSVDHGRNTVVATSRSTIFSSTPITGAMAVTFKESGQTASTDGSLSILEVAEQKGVSIRSGCRMGACGACKVKTCNAKVRYDVSPAALSSDDLESGHVLACVAYPVEPVEVHA